jgi:hypothetical protein
VKKYVGVSGFRRLKSDTGQFMIDAFLFQAIEVDPSNAVYYANRSIAYLRTECFGYALTDASKAIETDKAYLKECFYSVKFC